MELQPNQWNVYLDCMVLVWSGTLGTTTMQPPIPAKTFGSRAFVHLFPVELILCCIHITMSTSSRKWSMPHSLFIARNVVCLHPRLTSKFQRRGEVPLWTNVLRAHRLSMSMHASVWCIIMIVIVMMMMAVVVANHTITMIIQSPSVMASHTHPPTMIRIGGFPCGVCSAVQWRSLWTGCFNW